MGSKLAAKALMAEAGLPVLPGATVTQETDLATMGARIGFPLLVKAAYGGGGRGMRLVRDPAGLAGAVAVASREAASAFGDGTVFLERFVTDPRHVEVQILGDQQGTVLHLFERDCSIQRRYQKIVEESPSPAVDEALRAALGEAAVAAGKVIGYTGAGTVEFVLDGSGAFFFLEVNTRLQVEHPVTELVTGLDLVEMQLRIAAGEPLPPEVTGARITGHAIEARLYAEDVPAGFLPVTGTLHRFVIPAGPGVRVDAGYTDGSAVSPYYDAMLAKVIAHGRTRDEAAARLARALSRARLHGVTTNRDLLLGIAREPDFLAGRTDTGYLTRHDPADLSRPADPAATARHAAAAALAGQAAHRAGAKVLRSLPSGWRNVPTRPQQVSYETGGERYTVAYRLASTGAAVTVNGDPLGERVTVYAATPDTVDLEAAGIRRRYQVSRVAGHVYVDGPDGSASFTELPRFTDPAAVPRGGSLLAPMPGVVLRVLAEPSAAVTAGQPLVVLEAMKMEHEVTAPSDGILAELRAHPGQQVNAGQVLAVVTTAHAQT
jgi:acetyl/propionyl-CoA carboxylase alpha subunit